MNTNEKRANVCAAGFALMLAVLMAASADSKPPLHGAIDPQAAGQLPLPTIDPNRVRLVAPQPDLTITSAQVSRSPLGTKYRANKVSFCVKNIGAGATTENTTVVFANTIVGDTGSPPYVPGGGDSLASLGRYFDSVPPLASQQEHCGSMGFKTKGDEHNGAMFFNVTTNARLIVDRARRIVEGSESNNEAPTVVISGP